MATIKGKKSLEALLIDGLDLWDEEHWGQLAKDLTSIPLKEEDPTKIV